MDDALISQVVDAVTAQVHAQLMDSEARVKAMLSHQAEVFKRNLEMRARKVESLDRTVKRLQNELAQLATERTFAVRSGGGLEQAKAGGPAAGG